MLVHVCQRGFQRQVLDLACIHLLILESTNAGFHWGSCIWVRYETNLPARGWSIVGYRVVSPCLHMIWRFCRCWKPSSGYFFSWATWLWKIRSDREAQNRQGPVEGVQNSSAFGPRNIQIVSRFKHFAILSSMLGPEKVPISYLVLSSRSPFFWESSKDDSSAHSKRCFLRKQLHLHAELHGCSCVRGGVRKSERELAPKPMGGGGVQQAECFLLDAA